MSEHEANADSVKKEDIFKKFDWSLHCDLTKINVNIIILYD